MTGRGALEPSSLWTVQPLPVFHPKPKKRQDDKSSDVSFHRRLELARAMGSVDFCFLHFLNERESSFIFNSSDIYEQTQPRSLALLSPNLSLFFSLTPRGQRSQGPNESEERSRIRH